MSEYNTFSLQSAAELLASKEASSEELTQAVINSIKVRDPELGGYLSLDEEGALAQARAADERRSSGEAGVLLGIPIAVKDLLNVEGQPCGCASRMLEGYVAPYDATAIARLREAGAVFLGRSNMDEFAMGSTTENSAYQVTRNPWDRTRVAGGSSGGAAAVVAANEAIAALGSDTGGSIRQPASFCGCVGLKPSYGRISRYGLTAFASSLDQIGPLTKTVADAAILTAEMAGVDPMDSTSLDADVPDYLAGFTDRLDGVTLGLPTEYFAAGIEPEVTALVHQAVAAAKELGASVKEVSLPHTEYAIATYYIIATAEASANLARFDGMRYGSRHSDGTDPISLYKASRQAGFGPEVKRRIILGTFVLSSGYHDAYYGSAQKVRTLIRQDFSAAFEGCDALISPVAPTPALAIGDGAGDPLKAYLNDILTVPANLAGLCGLSLPCGLTKAGLPVGVQLLAPPLGESVILRIGHALEQVLMVPSYESRGVHE